MRIALFTLLCLFVCSGCVAQKQTVRSITIVRGVIDPNKNIEHFEFEFGAETRW